MSTTKLDIGPGARRICKTLAGGGILFGERFYPYPMNFYLRKEPEARAQECITDSMIARLLELRLIDTAAPVPSDGRLDAIRYVLTERGKLAADNQLTYEDTQLDWTAQPS